MNLHLPNRFFYTFGLIAFLFALSFAASFLFVVAKVVLALAILVFVVDIVLLYHKKVAIDVQRKVPPVLSLGDENVVSIHLRSRAPRPLRIELIDELPFPLQSRDFGLHLSLAPDEKRVLTYPIRPTSRGEYEFGDLHLYLTTFLGLAQRRITTHAANSFPVFPSIIQMKKFELLAISKLSIFDGIKRQRRIGHSYEFEQIKTYVRGDDYRSINWKATGRRAELMVNQYEDERSQQIYCIIDKSRTMKMPFYGLSLMDYAINTSLVLTNIALRDRKSTRLNSSHRNTSRMPSSA